MPNPVYTTYIITSSLHNFDELASLDKSVGRLKRFFFLDDYGRSSRLIQNIAVFSKMVLKTVIVFPMGGRKSCFLHFI